VADRPSLRVVLGVLLSVLAALPVEAACAAPSDPGCGDDSAPGAGPGRALPALEREPELGVLVARAARVELGLDRAVELEHSGARRTLGPGTIVLEARPGGWALAGEPGAEREPGTLRSGGRAVFALEATPTFGAPRRLRLAGDLRVHAAGSEIEVVERIGMEAYLAAVVGAEMSPRWPTAALAAQAIVARSYAAARWMERSSEPWQLHWHFGVDMAYPGWTEANAAVARTIAATRGEVLVHAGFPVLALFHASSGGRTESFERVKPGVTAPDGRTPIAAAMPVIVDAAALLGAAGLDLSASHGQWKADLTLAEVTEALARWSAAAAGRPVFGAVEGVSILARHEDSLRVATVSVRHRRDGATRFTTLPAGDFRLAVSPVRIRSLWWDRCVVAAKEPGYLVLEGRGFGHGCGLSQVSAWYLARSGESAEAIVARFYPGARIERRY
jgi:peptidoglycan hydrolase-like amidase